MYPAILNTSTLTPTSGNPATRRPRKKNSLYVSVQYILWGRNRQRTGAWKPVRCFAVCSDYGAWQVEQCIQEETVSSSIFQKYCMRFLWNNSCDTGKHVEGRAGNGIWNDLHILMDSGTQRGGNSDIVLYRSVSNTKYNDVLVFNCEQKEIYIIILTSNIKIYNINTFGNRLILLNQTRTSMYQHSYT